MEKDDTVFLVHILESIDLIERYVNGMDEEDFMKDRAAQDSVVRRFEIIGEASSNLTEEIRQNSPDVDWPDIIGMRNNLIHEYFGIDLETVWDTIKNDLPAFREQIVHLLEA